MRGLKAPGSRFPTPCSPPSALPDIGKRGLSTQRNHPTFVLRATAKGPPLRLLVLRLKGQRWWGCRPKPGIATRRRHAAPQWALHRATQAGDSKPIANLDAPDLRQPNRHAEAPRLRQHFGPHCSTFIGPCCAKTPGLRTSRRRIASDCGPRPQTSEASARSLLAARPAGLGITPRGRSNPPSGVPTRLAVRYSTSKGRGRVGCVSRRQTAFTAQP